MEELLLHIFIQLNYCIDLIDFTDEIVRFYRVNFTELQRV